MQLCSNSPLTYPVNQLVATFQAFLAPSRAGTSILLVQLIIDSSWAQVNVTEALMVTRVTPLRLSHIFLE